MSLDASQTLNAWYRELSAKLECPFPAHFHDGQTEFFLMVHAIIEPDSAGPYAGELAVDARQENRPMFVPLASLILQEENSHAVLLAKYRDWLETQRA